MFWFCLGHAFPLLPADIAWLFATRPIFLYPELLPICNLDPGVHHRRQRSVYTAGEDGYVLRHWAHLSLAAHDDLSESNHLHVSEVVMEINPVNSENAGVKIS